MEILTFIWEQIIRPTLYMLAFFYCIPYLVRKAWGDAENRTKKVCDVCYRDISKFNDYVKKNT